MSDELANVVPQSWALASLADLGTWSGGGTPSKSNTAFWSKGKIPWVSPKDMKTFEISDTEDHITKAAIDGSATSLLPSGTVLLVTRSGILRHTLPVAVARVPVTLNQDLKALQPHRGLYPSFIAYALCAFGQQVLHTCVKDGTTVQSVEFSDLKQFEIPIAPTNEQQRIADALDELLSDLDAGVQALQRAQAKLALYRASVLKAAVQGDLTAEWRRQHPDTESASVLLERILIERRKRWEQEQLRKFKAAGKTPPANWKSKYKEPVAPDTTNLPPLPEGWCWASSDQLAWTSGYGTSVKCSEANGGIPVLRIPNISGGQIELSKIKFAPADYAEATEETVLPGDLLVVRTNGSRALIGRGAIVFEKLKRHYSFASYLIRLRLVPDQSLLGWISLVWQSATVRNWIESKAATSAGQYNISLGVLQTLAIPIPPTREQEVVTNMLEEQFTVENHVQNDLATRFLTASGLRQSILRHAFTGQLVPQDPKDEPASELLKRIAAERAAQSTKKKAPRKQAAKRQKREK